VIRGPGVTNSEVRLFKNIPFGLSGRRLQLRWDPWAMQIAVRVVF